MSIEGRTDVRQRLRQRFAGKRAVVVGLGTFGGGVALAKLLAEAGADVLVTDLRSEDDLRDSVRALQELPIQWRLGGHRREDFESADVLGLSPAVPESSEYVRVALDCGAELVTEMRLFFEHCPAPIVGITGSNGKSTTTALTGEMLRAAGRRVWVGGNIGRPLTPFLSSIAPTDVCVVELSSFQLEDLARLRKSPAVAVVTNCTPNHLDRHGSMEAYEAAKRNILVFQEASDVAVLNSDDERVASWGRGAKAHVLWFGRDGGTGLHAAVSDRTILFRTSAGETRIDISRRKVPGPHNAMNIAAAGLAAISAGAAIEHVKTVALKFPGLEHRLEFAGEIKGIRFINDSIATTPESVVTALRSFAEPKILIAGGYDKKLPYEALAAEIGRRAKAVILIGEAAPIIEKAIQNDPAAASVPTLRAKDMLNAVERALSVANAGDVVLLSPACASYDMYRNFQERGRHFKEIVKRLANP